MLQVEMTGTVRSVTGKGAMRQLRMKGFTPAVVYGGGAEGTAIQIETRPLYQQLLKIYRRNAIVTLTLDNGETKNVLVKDVQTDPIKDSLVHVDFHEIDINKPRIFTVPINYSGKAKGCDLGGVMDTPLTGLTVEAEPLNVPDDFTVDVRPLKIGDSIKVSEVSIPDNLKLITSEKAICVSVLSPKKGGAEEEEAEEEAAE